MDFAYGSLQGGWCSNDLHESYKVDGATRIFLVILDLKWMMVRRLDFGKCNVGISPLR